jgi:hypothetical protein
MNLQAWNGYSWVEGNTPNKRDPSGRCLQADICDALRGSGVTALVEAGCINTIVDGQESCCGPDATLWLFLELANHYTYAGAMPLEVGPGFIGDATTVGDMWDNGFITWDNDIQRRIASVWQLMAYGLAVDYANLDYRNLQQRSAAVDSCHSHVNWRCEENNSLGQ